MAQDEKVPAEGVVRDIRRQMRRKGSAEEKIRILLKDLRGEAICRALQLTESRTRDPILSNVSETKSPL